jgi:hypothetical protein
MNVPVIEPNRGFLRKLSIKARFERLQPPIQIGS